MKKIQLKKLKIADETASIAGFSVALFLLFALFLVICAVSAIAFKEYFFIGSPLFFGDNSDLFMDFYNVNAFVEDMDPYIGHGSSYPPFVLLIAKIFSFFADYTVSGKAARASYAGVVSLVIFYVICLIPMYIMLYKAFKRNGFSLRYVNLIFIAFVLSSPFLYGFFRGNYIFLSLTLSAFFFMYYRDPRKHMRALSLICLAMSVGIKLYPAVFALILIRDKRWKDFLLVVLYCVILVVVPFFFFKGGAIANAKSFVTNLIVFSNQPYKFTSNGTVFTNFYSYGVSAANFVRMLYCMISGTSVIDCPEYITLLGTLFNLAVMAMIVCSAMVTRSRWKHVAAMVLVQTLFPDPSYVYSLIFMFIPIVMFVIDSNKKRGGDVGYALLFILIMSPVQLGYVIAPYSDGLQYGFSFSNLVQTVALLVMGVTLFIDGVRSLKRDPAAAIELTENERRGRGFFGALLFWACLAKNTAEKVANATVGLINRGIDLFNSWKEKLKVPREKVKKPKRQHNVLLWAMIANVALTAMLVVVGIKACGIIYGSVENFFNDMVYSYGISDFGQTLFFAMAKNPYVGDFTTSYAPLGFLFYKLFALICSTNSAFYTPLTFNDLVSYNKAIVVTPQFWICYVIYVLGCFAVIYFSLRKVTGLSNLNAFFLCAALLFSNVFIYCIARGSNVLLTFAFVALFIRFKDSENKVLRELGYISLAVAGVMKVYPLLFGVYLLRDKRYFACIRVAIYSAILFVVPFLFIDGGLSNIRIMVNNLLVFTNKESRIFAPKNLSAASLLAKFLALIIGRETTDPLMDYLQFIPFVGVLAVCAIYALRAKNLFSVSVFVMCGMTLVPSVSYLYLAIFTTFPIIEFIKYYKTMPKYKRIYYPIFFGVVGFVGISVLKDFTFISIYYIATLIFEAVCVNIENKKIKTSAALNANGREQYLGE